MEIKKLIVELETIKYKGKTEGLTKEDYIELDNLLKEISKEKIDYETSLIYNELSRIKDTIANSGILKHYTQNNIDYIQKNSLILPLVLANNEDKEVKVYAHNHYFLNCQFHDDKKPSMSVNMNNNSLHCYACKVYKNSISYLMDKEKIDFKTAIQLLCQIYLFDNERINYRLLDLVDKYQQSIIDGTCQELIEKSYQTTIRKMELSKEEDEKYNDIFMTLSRVCYQEKDPKFTYEEPPRVMYLSK